MRNNPLGNIVALGILVFLVRGILMVVGSGWAVMKARFRGKPVPARDKEVALLVPLMAALVAALSIFTYYCTIGVLHLVNPRAGR